MKGKKFDHYRVQDFDKMNFYMLYVGVNFHGTNPDFYKFSSEDGTAKQEWPTCTFHILQRQ